MKIKIIIVSVLLLLVVVFTCGCVPFMENLGLVNPVNEEQLSTEKGGSPEGLVKFLVGFRGKPGLPEQALVNSVGGKIKYTYHLVDVMAVSLPQKAIDALQKNPNVRYVEPDILVQALDGELDNSWGVKQIGAGLVHDANNKGAGIKVAIIDSGIDYNHPDLNSNYLGGYDFVNTDTDPMDDNGHGTHVAGTIAALDDGMGVVGVAPEANLYALKVLNSSGSGSYSDIIAALQWCVDNGIQVTNNSYGSAEDSGISVKMAFDNAYYNYGIINVGAAGNSGNSSGSGDNMIYPAKYDSVIAVAATDKNNQRASWSSTGSDLEISAPGVAIVSTWIGGGYGVKSGTSMASPHVAGTVALMIAAGVFDVRGQLQSTADDLGETGWDSQYGYGLVNAVEAVGAEIPSPAVGTIEGKVTDADTGLSIVKGDVTANGYSTTTLVDGSYIISDLSVGSYTVTASAMGYTEESQTAEVLKGESTVVDFALIPIPIPTPTSNNTMHVNDITIISKTVKHGKNIFASAVATVTIVDEESVPVEGATVSGHWSNATKDRDSGITDGSGKVSLKSNKIKNPKNETTFTFTLDKVKKDGWTYDSNANTKTSESTNL